MKRAVRLILVGYWIRWALGRLAECFLSDEQFEEAIAKIRGRRQAWKDLMARGRD